MFEIQTEVRTQQLCHANDKSWEWADKAFNLIRLLSFDLANLETEVDEIEV